MQLQPPNYLRILSDKIYSDRELLGITTASFYTNIIRGVSSEISHEYLQ